MDPGMRNQCMHQDMFFQEASRKVFTLINCSYIIKIDSVHVIQFIYFASKMFSYFSES